MDKSLAVALGGVLAAGAAIGAYKTGVIGPQYAEVVRSTPVTLKEPMYADVVDAVPLTQTTESPQKVCDNQSVQVRQPERFGNKDGTLIGAVVGGLVGHQVGGGNGRTLATVAGAVGGGYIGRDIDRKHVGGRVTTQNQRVCHTEMRTSEKTIGYEVRYQLDGKLQTTRVSKKPSDQVWLGDRDRVIGYDVDWRYRDKSGTVRLDEKPGERLPIRDGAIIVERRIATNG
ncbi:glycine zipper 2TM domain-containing protein [soil metagenome]